MPLKRFFRSRDKIKENNPKAQDESTELNTSSSPSLQPPVQESVEKQRAGLFHERDNRATRILRLSQADDFWREHRDQIPKVPFLRFTFSSESEAIDALLSIGCIHQAGDTGNLLCTEPIVMGCHRTIENSYEVFLAGEELSYATWSEAARKFSDHHGCRRDQLKPETGDSDRGGSDTRQVVFEKEYYQMGPEGTSFCKVFKASSLPAARSFLRRRENVIMVRNRSILVETPEGTLRGDSDGIHEN